MSIVFKYDVDYIGTSFNDYLEIKDMSFEEVVARLYNLSDQEIFDKTDKYKVSFDIHGSYKGNVFTLYDYKGDNMIHIGGKDGLDVKGLKKELIKLIKKSVPKPYIAKLYYDGYEGKTYQYPKIE